MVYRFLLGLFAVAFLWTKTLKSIPLKFIMDGAYERTYDVFILAGSLIRLVLAAFPFVLLLLLIYRIGIIVLGKYRASWKIFSHIPQNIWSSLLAMLLAVAFFEFSYTTYAVMDAVPHVPDAIGYTTQAKIFSMGKIYLPEPRYAEQFPIPGMIAHQGKWFSQYPFGHPLLLSIGYLLHLPWIMPALIATLSLLLIYLIGKQIYSARVGFFTAFLAFSSPFFKMNSIDFMSHNSALMITLLSTFLFIKRHYFLTGLALGFLINIRPYTGALIFAPFFITILFFFTRDIMKKKYIWKPYIFFVVGLTIMVAMYGLYNLTVTGDIFKSPYNLGTISTFGFSIFRSVSDAFYDTYINLSLLEKVLLGWPLTSTGVFLWIYLLTPPKSRWEYLFLGVVGSLSIGYFFYEGAWMMYGPRFWYEMMAFLLFFVVIGVEKTSLLFTQVWPKVSVDEIAHKKMLFLLYGIVICLSVYGLKNWYRDDLAPRWHEDYTPRNIGELKNFNYVKTDLLEEVKRQKISGAVIFINRPDPFHWWIYGIPSYEMDLSFQGDIIYALISYAPYNARIMEQFPNRKYYVGDYDFGSVEPY